MTHAQKQATSEPNSARAQILPKTNAKGNPFPKKIKTSPLLRLACDPVSLSSPPPRARLRPLVPAAAAASSSSSPTPPHRNPKWTPVPVPAPARPTPPARRRRSSATSAAAAPAWLRPSPTVDAPVPLSLPDSPVRLLRLRWRASCVCLAGVFFFLQKSTSSISSATPVSPLDLPCCRVSRRPSCRRR
jgi:hypothetical protein